jgi:hypothetical protein
MTKRESAIKTLEEFIALYAAYRALRYEADNQHSLLQTSPDTVSELRQKELQLLRVLPVIEHLVSEAGEDATLLGKSPDSANYGQVRKIVERTIGALQAGLPARVPSSTVETGSHLDALAKAPLLDIFKAMRWPHWSTLVVLGAAVFGVAYWKATLDQKQEVAEAKRSRDDAIAQRDACRSDLATRPAVPAQGSTLPPETPERASNQERKPGSRNSVSGGITGKNVTVYQGSTVTAPAGESRSARTIGALASRLSTILSDPTSVKGDFSKSEDIIVPALVLGAHRALREVVGSDFDVSGLPRPVREPAERLTKAYRPFQAAALVFDLKVSDAVETRFAETTKNTFMRYHYACATYYKMLALGRSHQEADVEFNRSSLVDTSGEHALVAEWLKSRPELAQAAGEVQSLARTLDPSVVQALYDAAVAQLKK